MPAASSAAVSSRVEVWRSTVTGWRLSAPVTTPGISSEIQRMIIGRAVTGLDVR